MSSPALALLRCNFHKSPPFPERTCARAVHLSRQREISLLIISNLLNLDTSPSCLLSEIAFTEISFYFFFLFFFSWSEGTLFIFFFINRSIIYH